jgi:F0F1-type ATP synthase membrane subunit c/vacuolar-type H+-ATPase subunit K
MIKLLRPGIFLVVFLCLSKFANAQNDTLSTDNLLDDLVVPTEETQLLPKKMLITQRILWGENGAMRKFKKFELSPANRQNELKVRRFMLVAHQVIGLATLGAMVGQGIVGAKLYQGDYRLKDTHETLAAVVNTGYFTTAGLSLFSPPKAVDERKGFSSIKAHRYLAAVHLTGMIMTNVLAGQLSDHPELRSVHRAAAYSAFGAYAAAVLIIKF